MTKKLDSDELKDVTGAGQDPGAGDTERLERDAPDGGGGGDRPEPADIQNPGLQHPQPE